MSPSRALVIGGTRGIGRAVAAALAGTGARVVLTGTRNEAATRAARELSPNGTVHGVECDVRDDTSVEAAVGFVREKFGGLDILVNSSGLGIYRPTGELSVAEFREVVETNLIGAFRVTKAALPLLLAAAESSTPATVVHIGSLAGRHPFAGGVAYNASKFGLVGMAEAMMLDLRNAGIRVATVMPGSVATGFAGRSPEDGADWKLAPEDVAEAVLAICRQRGRALISRIEMRPTRPPTASYKNSSTQRDASPRR